MFWLLVSLSDRVDSVAELWKSGDRDQPGTGGGVRPGSGEAEGPGEERTGYRSSQHRGKSKISK